MLDAREHGRIELGMTEGLAQVAREFDDLGVVAPQSELALRAQGGRDRVGVDVRVAVHVAADPRTEAQHRRQRQSFAVDFGQRLLEHFVEHRHDAIDRAAEIEADVSELVLHARPRARAVRGLPPRGQRHAQAREVGLAFMRRALRVEVLDQAAEDHLLFFQQRAPHGLGRMRGEHRLDIELGQPCGDLLEADARVLQPLQHVLQAVRLRGRSGTLVVAPATDAVHALGDVDDLEIRRERAGQLFGGLGRKTVHLGRERLGRRAGAAQPDRRRADRLDLGEERVPKLLGQHVADHRPEPTHVLAQRAVGRQEIDFASLVYGHRHPLADRCSQRYFATNLCNATARCRIRI